MSLWELLNGSLKLDNLNIRVYSRPEICRFTPPPTHTHTHPHHTHAHTHHCGQVGLRSYSLWSERDMTKSIQSTVYALMESCILIGRFKVRYRLPWWIWPVTSCTRSISRWNGCRGNCCGTSPGCVDGGDNHGGFRLVRWFLSNGTSFFRRGERVEWTRRTLCGDMILWYG